MQFKQKSATLITFSTFLRSEVPTSRLRCDQMSALCVKTRVKSTWVVILSYLILTSLELVNQGRDPDRVTAGSRPWINVILGRTPRTLFTFFFKTRTLFTFTFWNYFSRFSCWSYLNLSYKIFLRSRPCSRNKSGSRPWSSSCWAGGKTGSRPWSKNPTVLSPGLTFLKSKKSLISSPYI